MTKREAIIGAYGLALTIFFVFTNFSPVKSIPIVNATNPVISTEAEIEWPTGFYLRQGNETRFYMHQVPVE